jgi:hypothetical protein
MLWSVRGWRMERSERDRFRRGIKTLSSTCCLDTVVFFVCRVVVQAFKGVGVD